MFTNKIETIQSDIDNHCSRISKNAKNQEIKLKKVSITKAITTSLVLDFKFIEYCNYFGRATIVD